jgi:hypothetical protein
MSNFRLGFPTIQSEATLTASHTASTTRPSTNLFSGARSDRFELASTTSDCITLNYDLGVSTATSNFLAIMRAKLLAASGCSGVRLRGSAQPAFTSLTPTFHLNPDRGVTTTATRTISAITNYGTAGGTATQATPANQPLLSGASTLENRVLQSETLNTASWTKVRATTPTATSLIEDSTAANTHYISQTFNAVSGLTYQIIAKIKGNGRTRGRLDLDINSGGTDNAVFDLTAGTITPAALALNATISGLDSDGYRILTFEVACNVSGVRDVNLFLADGSGNLSYNGDGVSGFLIAYFQVKVNNTSPTYTPTTTFPIIAGLQGNRGMLFDGSNDSLGISLAVNPTGGMWGVAVIRPNTAHLGSIYHAFAAGATARFDWYINASGSIQVYVFNGSTVYIGRTSPISSYVAGEAMVLSFTYDGSTSSSGIKIFKNLTQIDNADANAGVYTVPTAGASLTIGFRTGVAYNGTGYEYIFAQGSTISDADRQAEEARLISKYVTTPLASIDFPTTYNGGQADDYLTTFTESAAYRHYWLQFNTESTSKFKVSKAFFGKALDLGREPVYPLNISKSKDNPWSRAAAYTADLNFEAVTDSKKSELIELIKKPELALVALDSEDVLFRGALGIDCSIVENDVEPFYATENDLSITLKENI